MREPQRPRLPIWLYLQLNPCPFSKTDMTKAGFDLGEVVTKNVKLSALAALLLLLPHEPHLTFSFNEIFPFGQM